jgi:tRNA modification GTPase
VECWCHGGPAVSSQLLASLSAAGARAAAAGEFTRRAVLNGKMDLVQAEAVADLVDAHAAEQVRAALHQVEGGLSRRITSLREQLLDLITSLSYDIDFPGEDDGALDPQKLIDQLGAALAGVRRLLETAPMGERLRVGALVVLAGAPNSGKSSLFNALLGVDRVLVTPVAGTTRDAVEADTAFDGWPIRLVDTAGLRDSGDLLEQLGIEVSRRYLAQADLVVLCAEAGTADGAELPPEIQGRQGVLVVRTKSDLAPHAGLGSPDEVAVSVVNGAGLGEVRTRVARAVFSGAGNGPRVDLEPVLLRERHRTGLERAAESLVAAEALLGADGDAALASHQVQMALAALDELVGVVDPDEILGRIFSRFCVGK